MKPANNLGEIKQYFQEKLDEYGTTAKGGDWNSIESQYVRFEQLLKVITRKKDFTILDFGCGYGAFADYLKSCDFKASKFFGYDLLDSMIDKAIELHPEPEHFFFTTNLNEIPVVDYTVASGVFNIRLQMTYKDWTDYVLQSLAEIDRKTTRGFAINFLTKYSDPEKMASRLYYADPTFLFDFCKENFSKNVALLHDYNLYDFTILVRK